MDVPTYVMAPSTALAGHGLCVLCFALIICELEIDECEVLYTVLILSGQALYVVRNFLKVTGDSLHGEPMFVQEAAPDYVQYNIQLSCNVPDFGVCSFYLWGILN
jgi:hypothetical protein